MAFSTQGKGRCHWNPVLEAKDAAKYSTTPQDSALPQRSRVPAEKLCITLCFAIITPVTDFLVSRAFHILSHFGPAHTLFLLNLSHPALHIHSPGFGINNISSGIHTLSPEPKLGPPSCFPIVPQFSLSEHSSRSP